MAIAYHWYVDSFPAFKRCLNELAHEDNLGQLNSEIIFITYQILSDGSTNAYGWRMHLLPQEHLWLAFLWVHALQFAVNSDYMLEHVEYNKSIKIVHCLL